MYNKMLNLALQHSERDLVSFTYA